MREHGFWRVPYFFLKYLKKINTIIVQKQKNAKNYKSNCFLDITVPVRFSRPASRSRRPRSRRSSRAQCTRASLNTTGVTIQKFPIGESLP